eukprot:Polyplicarium_translucidae@DN1672_c0_g1_i2.p1
MEIEARLYKSDIAVVATLCLQKALPGGCGSMNVDAVVANIPAAEVADPACGCKNQNEEIITAAFQSINEGRIADTRDRVTIFKQASEVAAAIGRDDQLMMKCSRTFEKAAAVARRQRDRAFLLESESKQQLVNIETAGDVARVGASGVGTQTWNRLERPRRFYQSCMALLSRDRVPDHVRTKVNTFLLRYEETIDKLEECLWRNRLLRGGWVEAAQEEPLMFVMRLLKTSKLPDHTEMAGLSEVRDLVATEMKASSWQHAMQASLSADETSEELSQAALKVAVAHHSSSLSRDAQVRKERLQSSGVLTRMDSIVDHGDEHCGDALRVAGRKHRATMVRRLRSTSLPDLRGCREKSTGMALRSDSESELRPPGRPQRFVRGRPPRPSHLGATAPTVASLARRRVRANTTATPKHLVPDEASKSGEWMAASDAKKEPAVWSRSLDLRKLVDEGRMPGCEDDDSSRPPGNHEDLTPRPEEGAAESGAVGPEVLRVGTPSKTSRAVWGPVEPATVRGSSTAKTSRRVWGSVQDPFAVVKWTTSGIGSLRRGWLSALGAVTDWV